MEFKKYVKLSIRTESKDFDSIYGRLGEDNILRLLHAALGISTEVAELFESLENNDLKNTKEELGDIFWYVALAYSATRGLYPSVVLPGDTLIWCGLDLENSKKALLKHSSLFVDIVKRGIYYDSSCLDAKKIEKELSGIYKIATWIIGVSGCGKRCDILSMNIEKLRKRYGDKFNAADAIDRDVSGELNHIA